jgi:Tfp pilus assembly protein PilF
MSLISDALKTAERQQRSRGGAPAEHPFFDGYFPHTASGRPAIARKILLAAGAIVIAGVVTSVSVMRLRAEPATVPPAAAILASHAAARPIEHVTPHHPQPATDSASSSAVTLPAPRLAIRPTSSPAADLRRGAIRPATVVPPAPGSAVADSVAASVSIAAQPVAAASPPPAVQITVDAAAPRPVDAIMSQALAAQRHGDYAAAKDLYDHAIKVGPVSAALYNNYGALLHDMGNSRDAVAMLRLALSLDQTFASAWVNLGNAQDALGDRSGAVSAYNQALKLDPSNRDSKVGLAWQYIAIGSFADARRLLTDVLRASPDFAPAHYALGQVLEGDKDLPGAVREFSRFLELGGAGAKPGLEADVRAHITALGKSQ